MVRPLHRLLPGVQVQALQIPPEQYWLLLQVETCAYPLQSERHSSTLLPLQRFVPGVHSQALQEPVPASQYVFDGQVEDTQPSQVDLQTCGVLPEHRLAPGTQAQLVQSPPEQYWVLLHVTFCHW